MLDAFPAGAGARTEHYEIAAYEGLVTMAEAMGEDDVVKLLNENLEQEKNALETMQTIGKRLAQQGAKQAQPCLTVSGRWPGRCTPGHAGSQQKFLPIGRHYCFDGARDSMVQTTATAKSGRYVVRCRSTARSRRGEDAGQKEAEAGGGERESGQSEEKEDVARQVIVAPLAATKKLAANRGVAQG